MTKEFTRIQFDPVLCRKEAEELRDFLATKRALEERKHVLPFFKARLQLSAFLGSYHPDLVRYDLVAHELPLRDDILHRLDRYSLSAKVEAAEKGTGTEKERLDKATDTEK